MSALVKRRDRTARGRARIARRHLNPRGWRALLRRVHAARAKRGRA